MKLNASQCIRWQGVYRATEAKNAQGRLTPAAKGRAVFLTVVEAGLQVTCSRKAAAGVILACVSWKALITEPQIHICSAGLHAQAAQKPLVLLLPTAATLFAIRELSGLLTMLVEVHREHMGRVLGEPAVCVFCKQEINWQAMSTERTPDPAHGSFTGVIQTPDSRLCRHAVAKCLRSRFDTMPLVQRGSCPTRPRR